MRLFCVFATIILSSNAISGTNLPGQGNAEITVVSKSEAHEMASAPHTGVADVGKVKLQYVDWGGSGKIVLFLTGFGNDAHVYDTFAPEFSERFHTIGLTRRGFGGSDKPASGYDTSTRADDIRAFLDVMGIDRVSIVGHSMAGDEMTLFASLHPDRVDRLVYLDAAYDHALALDLILSDPGTPPLYERLILEARGAPKAKKIAVEDMPAADQWNAYVKTMRSLSAFHVDFSKVEAPALAIYANPGHYPDIEPGTSEKKRRAMEHWWKRKERPNALANMKKFKREAPHGEVVELQGASHYLFLGATQSMVASKTMEFLEREPAN